MKPNKKKMTSDPIKRIQLNSGLNAKEIVKQIASALGFEVHENRKGVSAYGGNAIRLADHCTYMQTWVDNGTWNAPIRLDIVIEDEPTQAITQVKDGYDFTITEFVSPSNAINAEMAKILAYDIRNVMNGNPYANNIRGERRNLVATHGNNQENINCNKNMNMNKKLIRLTESDLHRIVKESVNNVLTELDWKTYQNAAKKDWENGNEERAERFAGAAEDAFNKEFAYDEIDDDLEYYGEKAHQDVKGASFTPYGNSPSVGIGSWTPLFARMHNTYNPKDGSEFTNPDSTMKPSKKTLDAYNRGKDELQKYADGKYKYDSIKDGGKGKWIKKH